MSTTLMKWNNFLKDNLLLKNLTSKIKNKKQTTWIRKLLKDLNRHITKEDIQIENKQMKGCSTSYVIRELLIKTIIRFHYHPIRMAKIHNTDNTKYWQGHGAKGILIHCWWECKIAQPFWKTVWQFLANVNMILPYNLAIMLLGIYPNKLKTYVPTKMNVYSSIIHNCQNLEAAKTSFVRWMDKQTVVYPYNWLLLYSDFKKMSHQAMKRHGGTQNTYCRVKETKSEKTMYCMTPTL